MGLFSFFRRRPDPPPSHHQMPADQSLDGFQNVGAAPPDPPPEPNQAGREVAKGDDTTELNSQPEIGDTPPQSGASGRVRWGAMSITGNFRENNEDSISVDDESRFFIVADGMGGQSAGEKASAMAVELIGDALASGLDGGSEEQIEELLKKSIIDANSEIMALGNVDPALAGMGTTVVTVVSLDQKSIVASVGDSRVYRARDGQLEQLTRDDSLTQALIDAGTITPDEARVHRYKNMLVKYLGAKEGSEGGAPFTIDSQPGDRLLMCSDGVTDGVHDDTLRTLLLSGDPVTATKAIVKAAQDGGSRDNISCIVIEVA